MASRFPPIGLFEQASSAEELEALAMIEGLTNDRLAEFHLLEHHVPRTQWLSGQGTSPIMAAFTHVNPNGSRFCDGRYGAYYGTDTLDAAICETLHHQTEFCQRIAGFGAVESVFEKRVYLAAVRGGVTGLSQLDRDHELLAPDCYAASQALGRTLKHNGTAGIVYPSVRHEAGTCIAAFNPRLIVPPAVPATHLRYVWNGTCVVNEGRLSI